MANKRFLDTVASAIIRYHLWIVGATVLLIGGLSVFAAGVKYTENIEKFLPEGPETRLFQKINNEFGGLNIALIGLSFDDLFTHESLDKVRRLTRTLKGIPGVFHINSLTNTIDLTGNELGADARLLIPAPIPKDKETLEKMKRRALSRSMIAGTLLSHDARSALLVCVLRGDADIKQVAEKIKASALKVLPGETIYFGGSPFLAEYMANGAQEDLQRLTPFVCGVILLIMFYLFRRPAGVIMSTICIVASISCTFGVMKILGLSLNLLSSSLPIILLAVGSAYSIHILTKYYEGFDAGLDRDELIHLIFNEVSIPVFVAGITTMIGFMSFYVMDIQPMREFGLLLGLGIFFSMIFAGVFVPAVLYMIAGYVKKPTLKKAVQTTLGDSFLAHIDRRKRGLAALVMLMVLVSVYYTTKIDVDMSTKNLYSENSEPHKAERFLSKQFGGSIYLQLYIGGDIKDPIVLKELERLNNFIATRDNVAGIQSIVDVIKLLNKGFNNLHRIPQSRAKLEKDLITLVDGEPWLKMLVNKNWSAALINIKLREFDSQRINTLIADIKAYSKRRSPGRLSVVKSTEIPSQLGARVREFRLQETLDRLQLVLGARSLRLQQPVRERVSKLYRTLDLRKQDTLAPTIVSKYLTGDEAAIDLADGVKAAEVGKKLVELHDSGGDRKKTYAYLVTVAHKDFKTDKQNLTTANETIWELIATRRRMMQARALAGPIIKSLNSKDDKKLNGEIITALMDLSDEAFNATPLGSTKGLKPTKRRMSLEISGYPVLYEGMNRSVRQNVMNSAMVSLILVFIVLAILFRSMVWGLIAVGPTTMTLLVTFGLMGVLRIPLDMGSSMITSITLGVGIDYSIHFLWRFRRLGKRAKDLGETMATAGKAIVFNAVTVTVGFSILVFASIMPIIKLGGLTAETMFVSALLTLVLIPLVFHLFEPYLLPQKKES